jgi:hypothetical protein
MIKDFTGPQLCDMPGCLGIARQALAMVGGAFVCDEHCELANKVDTEKATVVIPKVDLIVSLMNVVEARESLE